MSNRKINLLKFKILTFVVLIFNFYFLFSGFVSADSIGQNTTFNIDSEYEYSGRTKVAATLRKISDKAYWYVSDDYWAGVFETERNFFSNELEKLSAEFDSKIYPTGTSFWGSEWNPGIDNDPRITILVMRLIDRAGGYYDTTHEYKKSQSAESNEREMIFLNTSGVLNGRAKVFLAHELQHLISFNQKDKLNNLSEEIWLNEARSEYSVKLTGYDSNFENSNLRRRVFAFLQNSSEPLGEWKNLAPDYGAITLFVYYFTDHYGDKILVDSLKNRKIGIESINEALKLNGFAENFSGIFTDWTIANVLNDSSVDLKFAYKSEDLKSLKIAPTQNFIVSGFGTNISVFNTVKDWQPAWYEFNTSIGWNGNLKFDFSGSAESKFKVPYIIFHTNGKKEIGFMNIGSTHSTNAQGGEQGRTTSSPQVSGNGGTSFVEDFGDEVYKVILIPANHSKVSGFSENDQESSFNLNISVVSEVPKSVSAPILSPTPLIPAAQSVQMILDQIKSLQEQISGLQNQSVIPPVSPFSLNRDLFAGSSGNDVRWLQEFLRDEEVYPEARISGYFGPLTRAAVIRFQQKYGISPKIGYVGAKTRAKMAELFQ